MLKPVIKGGVQYNSIQIQDNRDLAKLVGASVPHLVECWDKINVRVSVDEDFFSDFLP